VVWSGVVYAAMNGNYFLIVACGAIVCKVRQEGSASTVAARTFNFIAAIEKGERLCKAVRTKPCVVALWACK
jgi:hypothetical protein